MSNKDQEPKKEFGTVKNLPEAKQFKVFLRTHRTSRFLMNAILKTFYYSSVFLSENGRDALRDPIRRKFLFRRESRVGLLEDSIINNELHYPNAENTSLEHSSAIAGRWVGFDFRRPEEFNLGDAKHERQKREGRLAVFGIDEIENNSSNRYTPTSLFNLLDLTHMLNFELPSLEDAINRGYIRESTYAESYQRAGIYDRYRTSLLLSGIADSPVYTVTPKGNGVVFLMKDGGRRSEKPKFVPELKPALQT